MNTKMKNWNQDVIDFFQPAVGRVLNYQRRNNYSYSCSIKQLQVNVIYSWNILYAFSKSEPCSNQGGKECISQTENNKFRLGEP